MSEPYLIETDDFIAFQFSVHNVAEAFHVCREVDPHNISVTCSGSEGSLFLTVSNANNEPILVAEEGDIVYSQTGKTLGVVPNVDELLTKYAAEFGPVDGENNEEKLVNIARGYFALDFKHKNKEYETVEFPYSQTYEDFLERAFHGMSTRDWWSFDYYFARTIYNAAVKFRNDGHSFPASIEYNPDTYADALITDLANWQHDLDILIDVFGRYVDDDNSVSKEDMDKAFEVIKKRYPSFWD